MATLDDNRRSGPLDGLFHPGTLRPCRHKSVDRNNPDVDRETILRIIPQVHSDGSILPMVRAGVGEDLDYSAIQPELLITYAGDKTIYHGWGQCSDRPDQPEIDMPFVGAYIKLKGRSKSNKLDDEPHIKAMFERLTRKSDKKGAAL
jgi:hypothetical protein